MTNKEAIEELKKVDTLDMPIRLCEAYYMSLKALEQEPCGETVSLEVFKQVMWERDVAIGQLKELGYGLGQKIEPKTGHWIGHREHCENLGVIPSGLGAYKWCSNCDCGIDVKEWHRTNYNYCPICGAKMFEPQERGKV